MNPNAKRGALVVVAMIIVVTALIWAGVTNLRSRRLAMQQQSSKEASEAMLVPKEQEAGPTPKLLGKVAPAFSLVDLDGKKVALADFKGKPVLVNFWATWCGPCKIEMPWFEEFHHKYPALTILGVASDEASKSIIAGTAKKLGVSYPVLLKDDKVESAYGGVEYLPESFYVGKDGKVLLETAGLTGETGGKDEIEANIRKLLAAGGQ